MAACRGSLSGMDCMRQEFPARVKVARFKMCGGMCEGCGAKLFPPKLAYDHDNPDGLTGAPTVENCRVLCLQSHKDKSRGDVADIARAKRREAADLGAAKRSSRPMAGTRASGIRKRMSGQVERW